MPFRIWKADAVQALARVNERMAVATRDKFWTRLYLRGFSPTDAAMYAACNYAGRHPPDWAVKARWWPSERKTRG